MSTAVAIPCFVVEPNGQVARWLRRYVSHDSTQRTGWTCAEGYHQAWLRVADAPAIVDAEGHITNGVAERDQFDRDEWPKKCDSCDYQFADEDGHYQLFIERLYERVDGGEGGPWTSRWTSVPADTPSGLPAGAMFFADWNDFWVGPDGRCLVVIIPTDVPEPWMVDGPASSGGHWSRSGEPPMVTATPSIHAVGRGYHGYLTNGELTPG